MKPDIHPDYHEITVALPDGKTHKVFSTYGKEGDTLSLEVDWRKHPAWTGSGSSHVNEKAKRVAKFNERFGNLSFSGKKEDAKKDEAEGDK